MSALALCGQMVVTMGPSGLALYALSLVCREAERELSLAIAGVRP